MIPKIIHYCWFGGGEIPAVNLKYIESWKKYCPNYEIVQWNESNYDVTKNQYMYEAYKEKKYSFVTDYARLDIIYENGGIYLDTDVEIIKPLDDLLANKAYIGFEDDCHINTGIGFGAEKNDPNIKYLMDDIYTKVHFHEKNGKLNFTSTPYYLSSSLKKKGLCLNNTMQLLNGLMVYPSEYFCPKQYTTNSLTITNKTYSIHHYDMSWMSETYKYRYKIYVKLIRYFPNNVSSNIASFISILKYKGIKGIIAKIEK